MAQNPAVMTIFADPQSTHQFDPGDPVMKIPNPVGKRNPHMGFLHAMREGEEMRSEEHTSELQSLMRNSYAVFCLKKKTTTNRQQNHKKDNNNESTNSTPRYNT